MNPESREEATEQLEKDIQFGFENAEELFESISEMFYDDEDFDENWLKLEIKQKLEQHQAESINWESPTDFERLVNAFDELNKSKIISLHKAGYTRQDSISDCLEILSELKENQVSVKGYCYYHTQDLERAIGDEEMLYIGYDSYNREDKLALEVAHKVVDVLKKNGFNVKWNGSLEKRIEILDINWKKTVDNIDYNYSRVIKLINTSIQGDEKNSRNEKKKPFWKRW